MQSNAANAASASRPDLRQVHHIVIAPYRIRFSPLHSGPLHEQMGPEPGGVWSVSACGWELGHYPSDTMEGVALHPTGIQDELCVCGLPLCLSEGLDHAKVAERRSQPTASGYA